MAAAGVRGRRAIGWHATPSTTIAGSTPRIVILGCVEAIRAIRGVPCRSEARNLGKPGVSRCHTAVIVDGVGCHAHVFVGMAPTPQDLASRGLRRVESG